jgi:hypothetical protein
MSRNQVGSRHLQGALQILRLSTSGCITITALKYCRVLRLGIQVFFRQKYCALVPSLKDLYYRLQIDSNFALLCDSSKVRNTRT